MKLGLGDCRKFGVRFDRVQRGEAERGAAELGGDWKQITETGPFLFFSSLSRSALRADVCMPCSQSGDFFF